MEHEALQQKIAAHHERGETSDARATLWKLRAARAGRVLCRVAIVLSVLHYLWTLYRHPVQKTERGAANAAAVNRRAAAETAPMQAAGEDDVPAQPEAEEKEPPELGFEPFAPLRVILPGDSIAAPLSVLDLERLTNEDCAANFEAITNKDWGKLRRVISTRLKPASLGWFSDGEDSVIIVQRFAPEGGVRPALELFAVTRTTLSDSRTVRESANRTGQGLSRSGTAPLLIPLRRDERKIFCADLGGTLALDAEVSPVVVPPPVTDATLLIGAEMRPHLNPKPLPEARPGDFVALPLHVDVEGVDAEGAVKGVIPADKTRPEDLPVEIRNAAGRRAGPAVTAGRRLRYDTSCSLQVIGKDPLVLIDRTVR